MEIDPDTEVLPTTGSKESIFSTPLAFVDRDAGDGVVWATPGYPIYERGARLAGAVPLPVRLADDFVFRAPDVPDRSWERARIVWINSPHNPAGVVISRAELARFTGRAPGATGCCSAPTSATWTSTTAIHPPHFSRWPVRRGSSIYLSLSKRSGMTGYRSGAVVGDERAIAALKSLRTGTGTAPPEFTQAAAIAAWNDDTHVEERRDLFRRKRAVISGAFDALGYPTIGSGAGLYVWLKVEDDVAITERLLERGVVVSPGRVFGPGGEGHIRLALVPGLEECEEAVDVLRTCLGAA